MRGTLVKAGEPNQVLSQCLYRELISLSSMAFRVFAIVLSLLNNQFFNTFVLINSALCTCMISWNSCNKSQLGFLVCPVGNVQQHLSVHHLNDGSCSYTIAISTKALTHFVGIEFNQTARFLSSDPEVCRPRGSIGPTAPGLLRAGCEFDTSEGDSIVSQWDLVCER